MPSFFPQTFDRILEIPFTPQNTWSFPDFRVEIEDSDVDPFHSRFTLQFSWNLENPKELKVTDIFSFVTPSNERPEIQSQGIITMQASNLSLLEPGVSFDLQIGAYQNDHLVSNVNVPIQVSGGPKAVPVFPKSVYKVKVAEDLPEDGVIAKIAVKNQKQLRSVKYSLIGVGAENFLVDENTGEIRCRGVCLDFESHPSHFFLVKAKSGNGVHDEAFALFYLDIVDMNDK